MRKYIYTLLFFCASYLSAQQLYVDYPSNIDAPLTQIERTQFYEVFGEGADFVKERPSLLKDLKDLLRNRVQVYEIPYEKAMGSAFYRNAIDLNSVPLYTAYNENLMRDTTYTNNYFNILKYRISFFPEEKMVYKLNNHYIVILPQKKRER